MKHINSYKLFENASLSKKEIISDCLQDIFDEYDIPYNDSSLPPSWFYSYKRSGVCICLSCESNNIYRIIDDIRKIIPTIEGRIDSKVVLESHTLFSNKIIYIGIESYLEVID